MTQITIQADANLPTIPWTFGGSTAELRIRLLKAIISSDEAIISAGQYVSKTCTVTGTTLSSPSTTIDSTTDAEPEDGRYVADLYDENGVFRARFMDSFRVPHDLGSTITWEQIRIFNGIPVIPPVAGSYTVAQTNALIAASIAVEHPSLADTYGNDLAAAVAAIGATENYLLIRDNCSVGSNVTVPANLRLKFDKGAIMTIASGVTVTINSAFELGNVKAFSGSGHVRFGAGTISGYRTAWWTGPTPEQNIDTAIAKALLSGQYSNNVDIIIPNGRWYTAGSIALAQNNVRFIGEGMQNLGSLPASGGPYLELTTDNVAVFDILTNQLSNLFWENLVVDAATSTTTAGIAVRFRGISGNASVGPISFRNVLLAGRSYAVSFDDHTATSLYVAQASFDKNCRLTVVDAADGGIAALHLKAWNSAILCEGDIYSGKGSDAILTERAGTVTFLGTEFGAFGPSYGTYQTHEQVVVAPSGITSSGNARVVITKAGLPGSPYTVTIPLTTTEHTSALLIASAIRNALAKDATVAQYFHVMGAGGTTDVGLRLLDAAATDATFNFTIENVTCAGITDSLTSTQTSVGAAHDISRNVMKVNNVAGGVFNISFIDCQDEGYQNTLSNDSATPQHVIRYEGGILQGTMQLPASGQISINGARVLPKMIRFGASSTAQVEVNNLTYIDNVLDYLEQTPSNYYGQVGPRITNRNSTSAVDESIGAFSINPALDPVESLHKRLRVVGQPLATASEVPLLDVLGQFTPDPESPLFRYGVANALGNFIAGYTGIWRSADGWLQISGSQGDPFDGLAIAGLEASYGSIDKTLARLTVNSIGQAATVNIACEAADRHTHTPNQNINVTASGFQEGQRIIFTIVTDGTTSYDVTWDATDFKGVEPFRTGIVDGVIYKFTFESRSGVLELVGKDNSADRLWVLDGRYTGSFGSSANYFSIGQSAAIAPTTNWAASQIGFNLDLANVSTFRIGHHIQLYTEGTANGGAVYGHYIDMSAKTHTGTLGVMSAMLASVDVNRVVTEAAAAYFYCAHSSVAAGGTGTIFGIQVVGGLSHNGSLTNCFAGDFFINSAPSDPCTTSLANILRARATIQSGITVTDLRGLSMGGWSNSGTVTTSYGIHIDSTIDVGSTKWAIYCLSTSPSLFTGKITFDTTITAGGTTGAATIDKPSGTVNFAAAATSLVVTNSFCTTSSIVLCVIRTNDATAVIKNVVPANGSFTINLNAAATAETSVGFIVMN